MSCRISGGLVLAAFTAGLGRPLGVVGEVAAAMPAAPMPRFRRALWVVGEIAAAVLAAFTAGLGSAFAAFGKIAAAATMLSHECFLRLVAITQQSCMPSQGSVNINSNNESQN